MNQAENFKEDLLHTYAEAVKEPVEELRVKMKNFDWDWNEQERRIWQSKRGYTITLSVIFVLLFAFSVFFLFLYIKSEEIPKVNPINLLAVTISIVPIAIGSAKTNERYRLFKLVRKYFQEK